MQHSWEQITNTCPFNITHHPAISMPCGFGEGERPIGLMLVAKHWQELTLYRAADAFERAGDWQKMGAEGQTLIVLPNMASAGRDRTEERRRWTPLLRSKSLRRRKASNGDFSTPRRRPSRASRPAPKSSSKPSPASLIVCRPIRSSKFFLSIGRSWKPLSAGRVRTCLPGRCMSKAPSLATFLRSTFWT